MRDTNPPRDEERLRCFCVRVPYADGGGFFLRCSWSGEDWVRELCSCRGEGGCTSVDIIDAVAFY